MSVIVLSIRALAVIIIVMFFVYLYGLMARRFRLTVMFWKSWIVGGFFGIVAGVTILAAVILFKGSLLGMILVPAVALGIGNVFLTQAYHREKEMELILAKADFNAQNEETNALYEEMSAAEETLQEQYDQLQKNREEIIRINERYKLIYQAGNEGLWEYDYTTNESVLSDRIAEIYGYGPEDKDFLNRIKDALIHPEDLPKVHESRQALNRGQINSYDLEYRILHASGEYRWIQSKGIMLRDEHGNNLIMAGSQGDIHQRKIQEQKLYESAYYDQLTGLPNRDWFMENLEKCVEETIAEHDVGAVLILGLDDFKAINDAMGHANGDEVLREVARRLESIRGEKRLVARLSGDEFLVLLRSIQQRYEMEAEIQRILELICRPIHFNDGEIVATASIGAVLFPKDAHTVEMILRNGDIALEKAKISGKNGFVFFDDKMAKANQRHIRLDAGLKTALANREFLLHYQPIFKAATRKLAGFEALVRWNSPEFGFVSPSEFIKLAEQNGRIVELGDWVLREACGFVKNLDQNGNPDIYLSVNLSPVQLMQKDFVTQVKTILHETNVSPDRIILEITESALMESFDASYQKILVLQEWGLNFSLDDFGTGYSSLNYLRRIPVKALKIDKSFIDDILSDQRLQRMVKSIIDISHDLNLTVIIEGVEQEAQLHLLDSYGCDCIQGDLLGSAVPETTALEWINPIQH